MFASIIVPCYNCEKTIKACINSILEQKTKTDFEIILVDDGSTDKTANRINQTKSKKIQYIYQKNAGPAKARNAGTKKAKGEIYLFTDSDCIVESNWLKEMLAPFSDKKVAAVQGAYKTKQKELLSRFSQIEIEDRYEIMRVSKHLDWVGSYSAAYRADVYKQMKGFDESFPKASGEDPELSYKVAEAGWKIIFNPNAVVYHTHPNSLKKYLKTKFFRAYYRPKMYSKHKQKMLKDSYTPQSLKLQILCFYAIILGAIISIFWTLGWAIILAGILAHILLGTKFFLFSLKKDLGVALTSPIILLMRSIVFGIGLIWGKLHG
ncbi:MAG: glycosyltransferase [archaeon]|jgi:glycosyltransferase involved in cell wall biosynthesis